MGEKSGSRGGCGEERGGGIGDRGGLGERSTQSREGVS